MPSSPPPTTRAPELLASHSLHNLLAFACLSVLALSLVASWTYKVQLMDRLDRLESRAEEVAKKMTTKWISGGNERSWTSTWKQFDPSETQEAFLQRHKDEVAIAKKAFPEDPRK